MAVVCAACKTENRDNAMFCHGCAGKLPAFTATGPSALEAMRTWKPPGFAQRAPPREALPPLPGETAGFWLRVGLLVLGCAIALVGWYAYVTRKPAPPAPRMEVMAAMAATPPKAPSRVAVLPKPLPPVPPVASLGAGEVIVETGPASMPEPEPASAPPAVANPRAARVRPPPPRIAAADPRRGCQGLNFIAAARCEAAQCDKPQFTHHPRCDVVRADRRRDEARRNPVLGT